MFMTILTCKIYNGERFLYVRCMIEIHMFKMYNGEILACKVFHGKRFIHLRREMRYSCMQDVQWRDSCM